MCEQELELKFHRYAYDMGILTGEAEYLRFLCHLLEMDVPMWKGYKHIHDFVTSVLYRRAA